MTTGRKRGAAMVEPSFRKYLLRLVPFFVTAAMYMSHFESLDQSIQQTIKQTAVTRPTYLVAFLKCLPIMYLIALVAAHEEPSQVLARLEKGKLRYKAAIAIGLTLGCIGDFCLVFPETFVAGMVAFAAGHAFYIWAFGMKPLKPGLGIAIFTISTILLLIVRDGVPDPLIKNAMPFYSVFLITMCWRGLARAVNSNSLWRRVGAAGGILFIISDFFIVLQFQKDIPYGELIVMTTYYLSQMCTALSVLDTSSNAKQD